MRISLPMPPFVACGLPGGSDKKIIIFWLIKSQNTVFALFTHSREFVQLCCDL